MLTFSCSDRITSHSFGRAMMEHNNSKIMYWWRVKGVFLLQSCHRAAECWRSPQKTPLHLVPRTKRWSGSHETTTSKADGQSCPRPVEGGHGLKGEKKAKKKAHNSPQRQLKVYSSPPPYIYSPLHLTVWDHWLNSSPPSEQARHEPSTRERQREERKDIFTSAQYNSANFSLLLKSRRDLR